MINTKKKSCPGPGQYDLKLDFVKQKVKSSRFPNSQRQRFEGNDGPAPNQYQNIEQPKIKNSGGW